MKRLLNIFERLPVKVRILLVVAFFAGVSLLFYQFIYLRFDKEETRLRADIKKTKTEIETLNSQIPLLKKRIEEMKLIEIDRIGLDAVLFRWNRYTQFLEEVTKEADESKISIINIIPVTALDKGDYIEVLLNVELRGKYRDLGGYLKRVELLPRLVKVKNIKIEYLPDMYPELNARIETMTYIKKPGSS